MATLQFYRDKNKSTTLDKNTSFFDNAQSDTGIVKVTTPGYGDNTGFVMMDFYMKHGQDTDAGVADGCYHDYYFRDRNGVLIGSAVRMDKNGVVVKDSPSGSETNLGLLMTDENVAEHWLLRQITVKNIISHWKEKALPFLTRLIQARLTA